MIENENIKSTAPSYWVDWTNQGQRVTIRSSHPVQKRSATSVKLITDNYPKSYDLSAFDFSPDIVDGIVLAPVEIGHD